MIAAEGIKLELLRHCCVVPSDLNVINWSSRFISMQYSYWCSIMLPVCCITGFVHSASPLLLSLRTHTHTHSQTHVYVIALAFIKSSL